MSQETGLLVVYNQMEAVDPQSFFADLDWADFLMRIRIQL